MNTANTTAAGNMKSQGLIPPFCGIRRLADELFFVIRFSSFLVKQSVYPVLSLSESCVHILTSEDLISCVRDVLLSLKA